MRRLGLTCKLPSMAGSPPSAAAQNEIRTCLHRDGAPFHTGLSDDELRAALASDDGLLWVDILADGREAGERILRDIFHFHPLTIDDCYNEHIDPPKVDDYGEYLFVIVHTVEYEASRNDLRTHELNLYIGRNYVVSLHQSPSRAVDEVMRRARLSSPIVLRGPSFLAHALIDVAVDDFHPVVETVASQVEALEETVLHAPERDKLEEILRMKRIAQRLRRTLAPQRDVLNRLSRGEFPLTITEQSLVYYRDVYDHTFRVQETVESVRDLGESALSIYLSSVNNKINEVMKILAIVTVVFLPLTLIASIYGTNFTETFPGYDWAPGFAGMIATMLIIAAALALLFRWRKWF